MRSKILFVVGLVVCSFNLFGCGVVSQYRAKETNDKITTALQVGFDRDQVLALLGNPDKREAYGAREVLFYKVNHFESDKENRFTPVMLENNRVTGWGSKYYDGPNKQKIEADITVKSR